MTRNKMLIVVAAVLVVGALAALVIFRATRKDEDDAEPNATAVITVAAARAQPVNEVVSVYGSVQTDPTESLTVAAPKALIVTRVLVRSGQEVASGQPLVEVADAPGSQLAYKQATDAVAFAQSDLARVQRLYNERLAANDQLDAAKKALADARSTLAAQQQQGAGQVSLSVRAPRAGIVTTVSTAAGDHVAQDAPLVVLSRADKVSVKLGLEPGSGHFSVGQAVTIKPVFGGPPIASRIAMVGRSADPTTKTLDAIAPLNGAALPVGSAVQGDIVTGSHTGLVVPRAAVVFDETGPHLFTVSDGKAHRVFVTVGLDHDDEIEVKGIAAGAAVAVEGAYELQDGMAVTVRGK